MSSLVEACRQNRLPSLSTMCDYGLDGRDGVNPIVLFEAYRKLVVQNKVTECELEHAMKTDSLKSLIGIDVRSGYRCIQ
jgi:hypothetical protein